MNFMTPTKDQAKQALQQIEGLLRNPDISGFTFDAPILLRNALGAVFAYVEASELQATGGPSPFHAGDPGTLVSNE